MKRVINGRVYDSDKSELIGECGFGHSGDFNAWEETLYKTSKGAYFVAGSGGPRSRYGRQTSQNTWSGSESIEVLSEGEALAWCERHHIDADTIAQHFEVEPA